jgi:hypothetical protein
MHEYERDQDRQSGGRPSDHRQTNRGNTPTEPNHQPRPNLPRPQVHQHVPAQRQHSPREYCGGPQ